ILQPRVTVSLPDLTASLYAKLHGNEPGIDPYTRATSDVYQDLFGEGSFIGKGIYEVDVFEKVLCGKFPENRILSHDLLEGCYTRSGLLSDVQLYEKYPCTYAADTKRRARWIRGDWQIAAWFTPFVPTANGHWKKNPLSALSRWKIFDNIRRSLVPIALTIFILLGWLVLDHSLFWTLAVSLIIVLPIIVTSIWNFLKKPKDVVFTQHVIISSVDAGEVFVTTVFSLICLPHEAYYSLISILRTNWRMIFSRKKLLEWNPSAVEDSIDPAGLAGSYFSMWAELLLAFFAFTYLAIYFPARLDIAGAILLLWLISPFAAWWTSKPVAKQVSTLTNSQLIFLRLMARKTWAFFERFVTEEDNWIPPDNFQENPTPIIACRTSPTNIGLCMLSNLSAHDFGYLSTEQFLRRTENTIETINKLEKYKGHLYNWYDTRSLDPLMPKYISTVDSGNLVGHIITLKQGLIEILHQKIIGARLFEGLHDTLHALMESMKNKNTDVLKDFKDAMERACDNTPTLPADVLNHLKNLSSLFSIACQHLQDESQKSIFWWQKNMNEQLKAALEDMKIFECFQLLSSAPEEFKNLFINFNQNPSVKEIIKFTDSIHVEISDLLKKESSPGKTEWLNKFRNSLEESVHIAKERVSRIEKLSLCCDELADVEWDFLYDKTKNLLTIGYKPEEHQCDPSFYDLLASEVRLGVFVGISQGKLPEDSWFALGRLVTNPGRAPVLLSWSGSMFEYLMPLLIMPTYENTLLDQTYKTSVARQIEYGKQHGTPWGNSESGYNMMDANSDYQYRAFGTPGLGLKRGLGEDLVIAPYATALALMVDPEKSCENLEFMSSQGFEGAYGFYEAIDYTPSRLQRGQDNAVVHSYMAHHQGMSFLSLAYVLLNKPMQRRFEAEPQFQATLLLLQERIPKATSFYAHTTVITDQTFFTGGTE
ncbi:MAG: glucoamylase family protein, partial [Bacteroidia bacterium]